MNIAVIIPAYNEEATIVDVINEYRAALPEARIVVGDNNSKDKTGELARNAGAEVLPCPEQGKGFAVRRLFNEVDADIYIMIDADLTYSADNIRDLIKPVADGQADMVVGARRQIHKQAFSITHKFGNWLLTSMLNRTFRTDLKDILSGYRVMSKELAQELVLLAEGFEIEAEMTIRSLQAPYRIIEIPVDYRNRPDGSESKLSTWGDGFLILYTIITLFRDYNPLVFFGLVSLLFLALGLASGIYIFVIFLKTGAMYHIGLAIFTALSILLSAIVFFMAMVLDSFNRSWRLSQESMKRNQRLVRRLMEKKD